MIHALTFASYTTTLDGRTVLKHARAAVVDNRVLLPVRALGNALGADVGYDGRAHTITVQRGARVATISARGAVRIVKGSAYAPLRTAANAFGMSVAYDAPTHIIALAQRTTPAADNVAAAAPTVIVGDAVRPPLVVTVTPAAHAQVHDPYPQISARFAGAASIDPRSLQVRIDDHDVSADANVLGDQVFVTPRTALMPGMHVVTIAGRDTSGAAISQQWSFNDTFAFSTAPPQPPRQPVYAIWIDRWITPGVNAFNIYVQGAPGLTGYVGIDGVGGYFPLQVYSANEYVAHVYVPDGVNQPFARVAARLVYPNGVEHTIVLPQTINVSTPPLKPMIVITPTPVPAPSPSRTAPSRRSVDVPTPSPRPTPTARPTPAPRLTLTPPPGRSVLTTTPAPVRPTPLPESQTRGMGPGPFYPPSVVRPPTPSPSPTAVPSGTPAPVRTRRPLRKPVPTPSATPA